MPSKSQAREIVSRELGLVAAFTAAAFLPWMGKAFHVDEQLYLPAARQILREPLRPLDFEFNWYGQSVPYRQINNTPPVLHYLLAGALKLTGGGEFAMRLCFLPFDLAAACFL